METPEYAYFVAIPWCAKHLQGEGVVTGPLYSRRTDIRPGEDTRFADALFADTLRTERTVGKMLQFYREPISPTEPINEVKTFLTLGNGLNSHPNICHGGILVTILDEVIGNLMPINRRRKTLVDSDFVTAYVNTTFFKPILTPATVLARARCTKREGRKFFAEGTIEDEHGFVCARVNTLFIQTKALL